VNCKVDVAVEDCLVDFFFEDSFLVEREERCALVLITRGRDDRPIYSKTGIVMSNAVSN